MFYFEFPKMPTSEALKALKVAAATNISCIDVLRLYQPTELTYQSACEATKSYRKLMSLPQSPPAVFINASLNAGGKDIAGYWLYYSIVNNVIGFVAIPAFLDNGNLVPIVPPLNEENPKGLEIAFYPPCPPPAPCADENALTDDGKFSTRFPIKP